MPDPFEALIAQTIKDSEQGALAFATGNGQAYFRAQGAAAAKRMAEAYDGDERPAAGETGPEDPGGA